MTIAYALELILELGVAMGATRYTMDRFGGTSSDGWDFALVFLSTLSVGGLIGLTIELARKRSPDHWGEGRWYWSLAGLYLVLVTCRWVAIQYPFEGKDALVLRLLIYCTPSWSDLAPLLVALWITARTARVSLQVKTDGREWAGRILGLVIVIVWIAQIGQHWWLKLVD